METFETLWQYCTSNERVIPKDWNLVYQMLKNKKQNTDGSWTPSLPLILGAWHITMPIEKQLRFQEHIKWAEENNQIEEVGQYLRLLKENQWYHWGEL